MLILLQQLDLMHVCVPAHPEPVRYRSRTRVNQVFFVVFSMILPKMTTRPTPEQIVL